MISIVFTTLCSQETIDWSTQGYIWLASLRQLFHSILLGNVPYCTRVRYSRIIVLGADRHQGLIGQASTVIRHIGMLGETVPVELAKSQNGTHSITTK